MNPEEFITKLTDAQGRSEFVIVVVADIRGFSLFSKNHESPDIAMFIKRFYHEMVSKYFQQASFIKPTGDGLLMTFPYTEKNLSQMASLVLTGCLNCMKNFKNIGKNDPMINFSTPSAIGFGITRGTACCLYSDKEILDYSGHLLNLASRLMDYARPAGVVIDGAFLQTVIPENMRLLFEKKEVYVRSIAEANTMPIFFLKDKTEIPYYALKPMRAVWKEKIVNFKLKDLIRLKKTNTVYSVDLGEHVLKKDIRVSFARPSKTLPNHIITHLYTYFTCDEYDKSEVNISIGEAVDMLQKEYSGKVNCFFKIEYLSNTH